MIDMGDKKNFIMTTNENTAKQLIAMNYQLVSHVGSTYTFLNNGDEWKQFFSEKDCILTNKYFT